MQNFSAALLLLAAACGHAPAAAVRAQTPDAGSPPADPVQAAAELSQETHALLRAEGDRLWTRWTTGGGPLPAGALAEHPKLAQRESVEMVEAAAARKAGPDAAALHLLSHQLATMAAAREAGAEIDAFERARAQLSFAAPGDDHPARGERDLDRLLGEEPNAQKRAAVALAEAKAAQALVPLALARDAAVDKAIAALALPGWATLEERIDTMIESKRAVAGEVIGGADGAAALLTEMADAELLRLVSLDLDRATQRAAASRRRSKRPGITSSATWPAPCTGARGP